MSAVLADTIGRALPRFQRRWLEKARSMGFSPEAFVANPQRVQRQEAYWSHLIDAVHGGDYRPFVTMVQRESANQLRKQGISASNEHLEQIAYAQAALMVECVREAFEGSPRELPGLMREMDAVRDIFVNAMLSGADDSASVALDAALPPPIITAVDKAAGIVRFVTTLYTPGQAIYSPDDTDHILYIVRSGRVRLYEVLPDRRMITLSILGEGDVFGVLHAGKNADEMRRSFAESMTNTSLTLIHESGLQTLMAHAPEVATQIIASLSAQLLDLQLLIENVLARDTSVRLIYIILKLAEGFGEPSEGGMTIINFPITHQDLANMIGSNRVTVTRKLLELQKDNLIVPERRNTIAVNAQSLKELVKTL